MRDADGVPAERKSSGLRFGPEDRRGSRANGGAVYGHSSSIKNNARDDPAAKEHEYDVVCALPAIPIQGMDCRHVSAKQSDEIELFAGRHAELEATLAVRDRTIGQALPHGVRERVHGTRHRVDRAPLERAPFPVSGDSANADPHRRVSHQLGHASDRIGLDWILPILDCGGLPRGKTATAIFRTRRARSVDRED
jgi:hypothetical protein